MMQRMDQTKLNTLLKKPFSEVQEGEVKDILLPALTKRLLQEFRVQDRGGLYGILSKSLAYNSNRIEGSRLTKEETETLFETQSLLSTAGEIYRSKDIEEMNGHFLMFNKMLQTLEEPLSEKLIKSFHYELTCGVFEYRANGYLPGEYKSRPNVIAGQNTTPPKDVASEMNKWLTSEKEIKNLENLLSSHAAYERIHPFQDGNGRTGRIILFREAIRHGILPFVILDEDRALYYEALKDSKAGNVQTFLFLAEKEQEDMWKLLQTYLPEYLPEKESEEYDREE